jgi:hypothetical protein
MRTLHCKFVGARKLKGIRILEIWFSETSVLSQWTAIQKAKWVSIFCLKISRHTNKAIPLVGTGAAGNRR